MESPIETGDWNKEMVIFQLISFVYCLLAVVGKDIDTFIPINAC